MTRSPDSLIPSGVKQLAVEKREDKAFSCRQEGKANLQAAIQVNVVSASSIPPVSRPTQLDLFLGASLCPQGEACHDWNKARVKPNRRDDVSDGIGRRHAEKDH